ncbi:MAG: metalloregulator ArsR/SmtB family transcription factor [Hyphomicrobiales bacterium]|nr:MAG: metalloregulator ArsR/SmtB family transcription factor [Hyphomicrobiales bacterium]
MSRKSKPPIALYSALADVTRCRILEILKVAPTPVHVLTEAFSISRPAISRHLRVLKSAGLVAEVKKGRENVYAFRSSKLDAAKSWLEAISSAQAADPAPDAVDVAAPVEVIQPVKAPAPLEATAPVEAAPPAEASKPAAPKPARALRKKPVFADEAAQDATSAPAPSVSQMGFDF